MTITVTDARSNSNDQIAYAANVLKRSGRYRRVFEAVCKGGKKPKTVTMLMKATGFGNVAVLQVAGKLADQQLVHKVKVGSETAYAKDRFFHTNRQKILNLAKDPKKLKRLPTKVNQGGKGGSEKVRIEVRGLRTQIKQIYLDDFDQFSKARKVKDAARTLISEKAFKAGITKLIGETGSFQDWGGEKNDLYTTKLTFKGKRRAVAFAFKGPGTKGILTPKKLGKNGNQIQRLFMSSAEVFVVQYHDQIDEDVIQQMHAFATLNSAREGRQIWYGIIDGDDTNRLMAAYPKKFGL